MKVLYTLSIFMPSLLKTKVKMHWFLLYKINWKEMIASYRKLLLKTKLQQDNIVCFSITSQYTAKIWKLWGNLLCNHSCESIHVVFNVRMCQACKMCHFLLYRNFSFFNFENTSWNPLYPSCFTRNKEVYVGDYWKMIFKSFLLQ